MAGRLPGTVAEAETAASVEAAGAESVQPGDVAQGLEIRGGQVGSRRASVRAYRRRHRGSCHRGASTMHPVLIGSVIVKSLNTFKAVY